MPLSALTVPLKIPQAGLSTKKILGSELSLLAAKRRLLGAASVFVHVHGGTMSFPHVLRNFAGAPEGSDLPRGIWSLEETHQISSSPGPEVQNRRLLEPDLDLRSMHFTTRLQLPCPLRRP